jgi:predicted O-linked N-acetylglucosamine transferase (SPINDLY family)
MSLEPLSETSAQLLIRDAEKYATIGQWALARAALGKLWEHQYKPDMTAMHLGDACMAEGDPKGAMYWHLEALTLNDKLYPAQEHLIFLVDAQPDTTEADAIAVRRDWWRRFGEPAYAHRQPHANWPHPEKRLRVGYVSSDYMFHSAAIAFTPVITLHTDTIEPVFYSTLERHRYDHRTKLWMDRYGDHFIDASEWSASMLANTIRADGIDILVDLSGFTGGNRMLAFAYHPAPIQIQAWGYVLGTASPAIDVVFADPVVCPPDVRATMHERIVDLPCLLSYLPRPDLPEPNDLPCLTSGKPVFSVFQRSSKVNRDTVNVWRQILERVPNSQLMFKGADYSPTVKTEIVAGLEDYRSRVSFDFTSEHKEHMLSYRGVDLSLDPWPQTGGVSTLEALWMGVPCVTLIGPRMIQRASSSILTVLGLQDDCIATDRLDYIEKAVALVTTKRDRLAEIRRTARMTMWESPIIKGYVHAVEAQYRNLWRAWCAEQTNEGVVWRANQKTAAV